MLEKIGFFFLCVFLFLMFGRPADFFFPSLHLPLVTSVTAMLVAVLTGGLITVLRSKLGLTMGALSAWFVLVIPFSTYRGGSFAVISSTWMRSYLCFVLILAVCNRPLQIRKIVHLLAWSLLVTSLLGLRYGVAPYGRLQLPAGLLTGPNELAGAMIVGILYWLFIFFDPFCSGIYRAFSAVAILPIMLVLLKTGSRGGMLSLMIVLVVMFFRLPVTQKLLVTCGAAVLLVMAILTLPDDLRKRFTTYFADDDTRNSADFVDNPTGSTDSRLYLLQRSIEFTIKNPIFGVGPDQFSTYEDKVSRDEGKVKGSWLGCHNTYTQISSETGLPGLFLFLAMIVMSWRSTVNIQRQAKRIGTPYAIALGNTAMTLRMVLIAYIVFFLFEHTAYMPFWPSLMGLIAALENGFGLERHLLMDDKKTPQPDPAPARLGRPQGQPLPGMA
jgi:O-antigen ligase